MALENLQDDRIVGIRCPRWPDQGHSEHANSGGFSGMQQPPIANFSRSMASAGSPQTIRRKLPFVPQPGHAAVFTVTLFEVISSLLLNEEFRIDHRQRRKLVG